MLTNLAGTQQSSEKKQRTINLSNDFLQLGNHSLNTRLVNCVMILHKIEKSGKAPEAVTLHVRQHFLADHVNVHVEHVATKEVIQEHNDEWGDNVIEPLNISTCWVSNGPNVQDSLQGLLSLKHSTLRKLFYVPSSTRPTKKTQEQS